MIRRLFRFAIKLGLTAAAGAAVSKVLARRRGDSFPPASDAPWPPIETPVAPAAPAPVSDADEAVAWVDPDDEGECPTSHPLKAKLSSGVFHLPGMANYERTKADRCYPDEAAAEADDLRQAKR